MLDTAALITLAILFPLSLLYVYGCDALKGKRK